MPAQIVPDVNIPGFTSCVFGACLSILSYNCIINISRLYRKRDTIQYALALQSLSGFLCMVLNAWYSVFPNHTCNYHYGACTGIQFSYTVAHTILILRLLLINYRYKTAIKIVAILIVTSRLVAGIGDCTSLQFNVLPESGFCIPVMNLRWMDAEIGLDIVNSVLWSSLFIYELHSHFSKLGAIFRRPCSNQTGKNVQLPSSAVDHSGTNRRLSGQNNNGSDDNWGQRLMVQSAFFAILACLTDFISAIVILGDFLEPTLNLPVRFGGFAIVSTLVTALVSDGTNKTTASNNRRRNHSMGLYSNNERVSDHGNRNRSPHAPAVLVNLKDTRSPSKEQVTQAVIKEGSNMGEDHKGIDLFPSQQHQPPPLSPPYAYAAKVDVTSDSHGESTLCVAPPSESSGDHHLVDASMVELLAPGLNTNVHRSNDGNDTFAASGSAYSSRAFKGVRWHSTNFSARSSISSTNLH